MKDKGNLEESNDVEKTSSSDAKSDAKAPDGLIREVGRRLSIAGDEITVSFAVPQTSGVSLSAAHEAVKLGVGLLWRLLVNSQGCRMLRSFIKCM